MPIKPNSLQKMQNSQSGNVLIMILIAVALLAALTFTLTKSEKDRGNTSDSASARVIASQIVKEAASYKAAWAQLILNGCSEDEISFEHDALSPWLSNSRSPGDNSCHIFDSNGGALQAPQVKLSYSGTDYNWLFSGARAIDGFGNDTYAEILGVIFLPFDSSKGLEICNQINRINGLKYSTDKPPSDRAAYSGFSPLGQHTPKNDIDPSTTSATIGEGGGSETDGVLFSRQTMGCYTQGTTGKHGIVYAVIQTR